MQPNRAYFLSIELSLFTDYFINFPFSDYNYLNNYEQPRTEVNKAFLVAQSSKLIGSNLYSIEALKSSNSSIAEQPTTILNYLGCK